VLWLHKVISFSAWGLALSQLPFIVNFFLSLRKGKAATINAWDSTTLEWAAPSPPPHGNFSTEPRVYRNPYEYSVPGADKDFTPQFEPGPTQPEDPPLEQPTSVPAE
jgi:cytochrome c oxidase subunit I